MSRGRAGLLRAGPLRAGLLGAGLALAAVAAPAALRPDPPPVASRWFGETFVEARVAEAAARDDGPESFNRDRLRELARRLDRSAAIVPLAIGVALALVGAGAFRSTLPGASRPLLVAWTVAAIAAGAGLVEQLRSARDAARAGVFTEGDEARTDRFFGPDVARAAARVRAAVPEDARVLVIRIGVPRDLNALAYLIFPRRVFMPPRSDLQLSADQLRALLDAHPEAIRDHLDAGYTHALDLRRLVGDDDPDAIVDLRGAR